ncbi:MAG TPA: hypothetical protein VGL86_06440 [Polyangia bacterium]
MALTLEVTYADRSALKHALESQLARGGLYVAVDASALPPLCELVLRLCGNGTALEVPARLTVATAEAACVEIAAAALGELVAAVGAHAANAAAQPGAATARIVDPAADAASDDAASDGGERDGPDTRGVMSLDRKIAVMAVGEKVQLALHGNRDARQLLMRDRAGIVQSSLVRNPKTTLDEVQALARAPHLAADTAEMLAAHPVYGASPQVALALVRNPRTPLPTATLLIAKLSPADLRTVAKGLGVRTQVAAAARKRLVDR